MSPRVPSAFQPSNPMSARAGSPTVAALSYRVAPAGGVRSSHVTLPVERSAIPRRLWGWKSPTFSRPWIVST